jgi:hypothetical protein
MKENNLKMLIKAHPELSNQTGIDELRQLLLEQDVDLNKLDIIDLVDNHITDYSNEELIELQNDVYTQEYFNSHFIILKSCETHTTVFSIDNSDEQNAAYSWLFNSEILNQKYYKNAVYSEYPYQESKNGFTKLLSFGIKQPNGKYEQVRATPEEEKEFIDFFTKKGWSIFGSNLTVKINDEERVSVLPLFCK